MHNEEVLHNDYFNKTWIEWVTDGKVSVPFLHQDLRTEWCVSTYKTGLKRILGVLRLLHLRGIPILYIKIPIDDHHKKFEEMIGFTEYARDSDNIFMFQRTDI